MSTNPQSTQVPPDSRYIDVVNDLKKYFQEQEVENINITLEENDPLRAESAIAIASLMEFVINPDSGDELLSRFQDGVYAVITGFDQKAKELVKNVKGVHCIESEYVLHPPTFATRMLSYVIPRGVYRAVVSVVSFHFVTEEGVIERCVAVCPMINCTSADPLVDIQLTATAKKHMEGLSQASNITEAIDILLKEIAVPRYC